MELFERLREERKRLGMNQSDFGRAGGVGKTTQINYESGERKPDSSYFEGIANAGADVQYIVTGVRSETALTPDERQLLALFRSAPLTVKAAAIGALQSGTAPARPSPNVQQTFHGAVGQQVNGDVTNHGPINVGGKRKKS